MAQININITNGKITTDVQIILNDICKYYTYCHLIHIPHINTDDINNILMDLYTYNIEHYVFVIENIYENILGLLMKQIVSGNLLFIPHIVYCIKIDLIDNNNLAYFTELCFEGLLKTRGWTFNKI